MAVIKRTKITSVDENVEKKGTLCTVGGIVNWFSTMENSGVFSKD